MTKHLTFAKSTLNDHRSVTNGNFNSSQILCSKVTMEIWISMGTIVTLDIQTNIKNNRSFRWTIFQVALMITS